MAIQAKCPDCGAEYNLRDDMRGKTVRCKKCTNTFTVREPEQGRQAPLKPPGEEPEDLSPAKKKADPDAIQPGSRPVKDQGTNAPRSPKRPSRRDHDDDEFDAGGRRDLSRKQKSPVVMILLIVGLVVGVLGLCCGLPLGVFFWLKGKAEDVVADAREQLENTAITPFGFSREPKDIGEALEALRDTDNARQYAAAGWLARQRVDAARQTEVAKALDPLLTAPKNELHQVALQALKVWGTKDNVPSLIVVLQDKTSGNRGLAIEVAATIKDPLTIPLVAEGLANFFEMENAKNALQAIGRDAEREVAKYVFHPDGGARDRANFLLRAYQTKQSVVLDQVIVEFKGPDNNRRKLAVEWLEKAMVDQARRAEIARALDPLLIDRDNGLQGAAMKAAAFWATKDNVPTLLRVLADTTFHHHYNEMRKQAMLMMAKLKDERAIKPIGERLTDFHDRRAASDALKAMGPIAAPEVRKYLNHADQGVRDEAKRILISYGAKDNVGLTQALGDLGSPDAGRRRAGADAIARTPLDAKQQKEVALALQGLLSDNDNGVRQAAIKALMVWATKDSVPALVKVLDNKDAASRHLALQVLGKLRDERSVVPVATRLLEAGDRRHASNALVAMGSMCEDVVGTALGNNDRNVRLEACKILEKVGTKKSVKTLEKAVLAYTKAKDTALANAARAAAVAAGGR